MFHDFEKELKKSYYHMTQGHVSQESFNKSKMHLIRFEATRDNMLTFNSIYRNVRMICQSDRQQLQFTDDGSIMKDKRIVRYTFPCAGVYMRKCMGGASIELVYMGVDISARFLFGVHETDSEKVPGRIAFLNFKNMCNDFGVDLYKFAQDHDEAYCNSIERQDITVFNTGTFEADILHVDFNSAYMGAIAEGWPELYPVINEIYTKRKDPYLSKKYKSILVATYGFMRSKFCKYQFAHMSKYAVERTNELVRNMDGLIKAMGGQLLLNNSDGVWFISNPELTAYLKSMESTELGAFKIDHEVSKIHIVSAKKYEYIDNKDGYTPVFSGVNKEVLTQEGWGSIDKHHALQFKYIEGVGIHVINEKDV